MILVWCVRFCIFIGFFFHFDSHFVCCSPVCRRSVVVFNSSCRIKNERCYLKIVKLENERPNCTIFLCVFFIKYKSLTHPSSPAKCKANTISAVATAITHNPISFLCSGTEMRTSLLLENDYSPSFSLKNFSFFAPGNYFIKGLRALLYFQRRNLASGSLEPEVNVLELRSFIEIKQQRMLFCAYIMMCYSVSGSFVSLPFMLFYIYVLCI